jgi:hypothetical protein
MFPLIVLSSLTLAAAGSVGAASPKKPPSYNQNRLGPYAVGNIGMTSYTSDQAGTEAFLLDFMTADSPAQNLQASSDDSDFGYQAYFGYRFHRYVAAEFGLLRFGELTTRGSGEVDYEENGNFESVEATLKYHPNGLLISAVGILPLGTKFEAFGRLGYMFSNVEREIVIKTPTETLLNGSFRDDSGEVLYGVGLMFNINQAYSVRAEYQFADKVGGDSVGSEDFNFLALGFQVRF